MRIALRVLALGGWDRLLRVGTGNTRYQVTGSCLRPPDSPQLDGFVVRAG